MRWNRKIGLIKLHPAWNFELSIISISTKDAVSASPEEELYLAILADREGKIQD